jgi:hypothetical protein
MDYPNNCTTAQQKMEFLYRAQELLRQMHNIFSKWLHVGYTQAQYDNMESGIMAFCANDDCLITQAEANRVAVFIRNNYQFKPQLNMSDWDNFLNNHFYRINNKIGEEMGVQETILKRSQSYEPVIEEF